MTITAQPTGDTDNIKEIRTYQYTEYLGIGNWNNDTFTESDFSADADGEVSITTKYGDDSGIVAPEYFSIVIIDSNNNTVIISQSNDTLNTSAFVTTAQTYYQTTPVAYAGATAGAGAYYGATATSVSLSSGGVVLVGATGGTAGVYTVAAETAGSAQGERTLDSYSRTVPATETSREWDRSELESVGLYQNNDVELPLRLPAGELYEAPSGEEGFDRGFGEEYIYRTPGINDQGDINEVLQQPNAIEQQGDYTLVIGDNPNGQGEIGIQIGNGLILNAVQIVEDPQGNRVEINREDRHPVQDDSAHPDSWDEIEEAVRNPDEIWESGRSRFYVKEINGRYLVVRTRFDGTVWTVGTAAYEGPSISDVRDLLQRKGFNILGDKVYP